MRQTIDAVTLIKLPHHVADNGDLVVMEGMVHFPFSIARVFVVRAPVGAVRGRHAHKTCSQLLICTIGSIEVLCDDGFSTHTYLLDRPSIGLLVPPGIWAQQTYLSPESVLTVLCDMPYEEGDYVRGYDDFKAYGLIRDKQKFSRRL